MSQTPLSHVRRQDDFPQALVLHQRGDLAAAARLYAAILAKIPHHFDALQMFGILRAQRHEIMAARELLQRALKLKRTPQLLFNYANVLLAAGEAKGAITHYGEAIEKRPDYADALHNRAEAYRKEGRLIEALADYDRAVAIAPRFAEAIYNKACTLHALERLEEAVDHYRRVIALVPRSVSALNRQGMALRQLGRVPEAIQCYDAALAIAPGDSQILNNRGAAFFDANRLDAALADYDRAIAGDPVNAQILNNRAIALLEVGKARQAIADFDAALRIGGHNAEFLTNKGAALRACGAFDAAITCFEQAIAIDPGYANAYWNKGVSRLLKGDYAEGWKLYDWRKKLPRPVEDRSYPQPFWTGKEGLEGETIFLYAEQGLGDTLQFYRFLSPLKDVASHIFLSVQDSLIPLLRSAEPPVALISSEAIPAAFDFHLPLASLPLALGVGSRISSPVLPYVRAEPKRVAHWCARMGPAGFKVGICWQGAQKNGSRSVPLDLFEPLGRLEGVRLISLQKGFGSTQLQASPWARVIEELGDDFDTGPAAFLDSAALMENLDLVITVDTAMAHLAGAMARPVWVVLKDVPDWRWQIGRSDSPWYPTMRLFRQKEAGDWAGVFAAMQRALAQLIDRPLEAVGRP